MGEQAPMEPGRFFTIAATCPALAGRPGSAAQVTAPHDPASPTADGRAQEAGRPARQHASDSRSSTHQEG
jgi:hypothetical protein